MDHQDVLVDSTTGRICKDVCMGKEQMPVNGAHLLYMYKFKEINIVNILSPDSQACGTMTGCVRCTGTSKQSSTS
uniref:Uncharacterized protein n=1 Tax=Oryza punctata TaxID=4537 RepID=A0A0E0LBU6_ORYPU